MKKRGVTPVSQTGGLGLRVKEDALLLWNFEKISEERAALPKKTPEAAPGNPL